MAQSSPVLGGAVRNPSLHHVALVVNDLDVALKQYEQLGFDGAERFAVPEQHVEAILLRSGAVWIELIWPTEPDGPIARFLAKRGEGVHHVAFAVPDLGAALADLAESGVRLIDDVPRTGLHGWRMAFIHPESCGGVLTELIEE